MSTISLPFVCGLTTDCFYFVTPQFISKLMEHSTYRATIELIKAKYMPTRDYYAVKADALNEHMQSRYRCLEVNTKRSTIYIVRGYVLQDIVVSSDSAIALHAIATLTAIVRFKQTTDETPWSQSLITTHEITNDEMSESQLRMTFVTPFELPKPAVVAVVEEEKREPVCFLLLASGGNTAFIVKTLLTKLRATGESLVRTIEPECYAMAIYSLSKSSAQDWHNVTVDDVIDKLVKSGPITRLSDAKFTFDAPIKQLMMKVLRSFVTTDATDVSTSIAANYILTPPQRYEIVRMYMETKCLFYDPKLYTDYKTDNLPGMTIDAFTRHMYDYLEDEKFSDVLWPTHEMIMATLKHFNIRRTRTRVFLIRPKPIGEYDDPGNEYVCADAVLGPVKIPKSIKRMFNPLLLCDANFRAKSISTKQKKRCLSDDDDIVV